MKPFFFIVIAAILLACNNSPRQSEEISEDSTAVATKKVEPVVDEQCYLFIAAKDTYALKLNIIDTAVRGTAVFRNFEKDSNHGNVVGKIDGDIIQLWYNFQSEGMNSVRELYFKKEGDQLITGISNEAIRADTAYVPDAKAVSYTGPVYIKGNCADVPKR